METRPRNPEDGIATCMLCGELLKGRDKVKYQGWWCHTECVAESLEKNVDNFDKKPFWIGSLGAPVGILLTLTLFVMSLEYVPILNPWPIAIPFLGMAAGLAFQSVGFYGFYSRYYHNMGVVLALFAIISALCHAAVGALLLMNGFDPAYYSVDTGQLMPLAVPGVYLILFLSYGSLGLLMLITAIEVVMLEGTIGTGNFNRVLAVIFIGLVALAPATPINIVVELSAITILFLNAGVPNTWRDVSLDE